MKNIKQIREEKEKVAPTSDEERKLTQLVRAGLFDAKKLSILKRALRKENIQMTRQERDTLLQLLDVLLDMITSNRQLFTKVKQSVNEQAEENDEEFSMARGEINTIMAAARRILDKLQGEGELEAWVQSKITKAEDYISTVADHLESGEALDESKLDRTVRDINDLPNIIVLRRRAVRVFPDGYKVVMYWADKVNRYIPIPVDPNVMTRGLDLNEATYDYLHKKYLNHIEKAHSYEDEDHPDVAVHLDKASRVLKHVRKNFGNESRIRLQALGKQTQKKAEKQRDYRAGLKMTGSKGVLATSGQMLKSGKRGAALGTLIGGAIGAGIRNVAKRMTTEGIETTRLKLKKISVSPLTGVRKTPTSNTALKESFYRNLEETRKLQLDEGAVKDFTYGDLDDASASSVLKDLTPGLGTARAAERTRRDWNKGNYGSAALNAADTALSGVSDAALAIPVVGTLASGAIKAGLGAVKGVRAGYRAYKAYKAAKAAKATSNVAKVADTAKVAKTADTAANVAKTADVVKTADKTADAAKAGEAAADAAKVADKTVDAAKAAKTASRLKWARRLKAVGKLGAALGAGGAAASGGTAASTEYATHRREIPRIQGQDSFAAARRGDYNTRETSRQKQIYSNMKESNIKTLKTIEEGTDKTLLFNDGSQIDVNHLLAQKIINIYESVNKNNKQLMASMLNESVDSFKKISNFAISNRK